MADGNKVYIVWRQDGDDVIAATLDEEAAKHYCDVHNFNPNYKDYIYDGYDLDDFDPNEEQRKLYTCAILLKTGEVIGEEEKIVIVNKYVDMKERELDIKAGPFSDEKQYKPSDLAIFARSFISAEKACNIAKDYRDLIIGSK